MSASSSAAIYVGRIGGLAVALGVGAALASGTGIAWADTADSPSSSQSSQSSNDRSAPASKRDTTSTRSKSKTASTTKDTKTGSDDTGADDNGAPAPDSDPADEKSDDKPDKKVPEKAPEKPSDDAPAAETPKHPGAKKNSWTKRAERVAVTPATAAPDKATRGTVKEVTDSSVSPKLSVPVSVSTHSDTTPLATLTATVKQAVSAAVTQSAAVTSEAPVQQAPVRPRLVTRLMSALGMSTTASNTPATPAQSPAMLALLGWVRREAERTNTATSQTSTSTAVSTPAAAAVVDPLPSSLPSTPVGWVTGQNNNPFLGLHIVPQTQNTSGFNIYGTDLGIMWDGGTINGERFVHLAFGDTFSGANMQGNWRNNVLLISYDKALTNGLTLAPTGPAYQFIDRSNGQLGLFGSEVTVIPTAGIQIDGTQYVNYMSVRSWDTPGSWTTNYSAITQFYPGSGGGDWRIVPSTVRSASWFGSSTLYRPGDQNFQQMAYVLQPEDQVAEGETRYLYAFGTPAGRAGSAFLSRVAEDDVTDLSRYEYWDGNNWVAGNAAVAAPIIGDSNRSAGLFGFVVDWANDPNVFGGALGGLFGAKTGGNVSEMSVQYNEYLDKYVILYGDGNNNIQMRVADTPEGAWSDPVQLASSLQYPGLYAPMIHPWSGTGLLQGTSGSDYNNLYWNMSIWGDYNVVLMQTDLSPLQTVQV